MTGTVALPAPYERLRLPRWARPWLRTWEDELVEAVAVDVVALGATVNAGTTVSKSVTSNATGNRGALVLVIQRDSGGTAGLHAGSCTYGGTSMTQVGATLVNGHGVYAYELAAPATGTQTVTFTCAANGGSMNIAVIVATGVDQTTVVQNFLTASGNSTSGSVAVTGLGGSDLAGAIFGSATAGAGWTSGGQDANSTQIGVDNSGSNVDVASSYRLGSGGTGNMTFAVTTGQWSAGSAQFLAAAAAAHSLVADTRRVHRNSLLRRHHRPRPEPVAVYMRALRPNWRPRRNGILTPDYA